MSEFVDASTFIRLLAGDNAEQSRRSTMRLVTTLTSKGQVTIPKAIRDKLGLKPHDKIRFSLENGHIQLMKAYPSLEEVVGSIPAIDVPMEEWDEIIQDEAARRYAEKFL